VVLPALAAADGALSYEKNLFDQTIDDDYTTIIFKFLTKNF
jgi:hypothetical protein